MSEGETVTDDKDLIADCAESLERIAYSLEQICELLQSCKSHLSTAYDGEERCAIRTIPITD